MSVALPCAHCGHAQQSHDTMDEGGCRVGWTYLCPAKRCQCIEYVAPPTPTRITRTRLVRHGAT